MASVERMIQALWEDRRLQEAKLAEERKLWEEERRRREGELEEERRRRQEETSRREEQVYQQMQVLQALVEGVQLQGEAMKRRADNDKEVKVAKLTDQDDIVSYLTTFERLMTAYEVKRERWAFKIAPCLSGKAQKAYASLSVADASKYDQLKEAILRCCDITDESYRQRFRSVKRDRGESNREMVARLNDLATKWLKSQQSRDQVLDQIVCEQFLKMLPVFLFGSEAQRQAWRQQSWLTITSRQGGRIAAAKSPVGMVTSQEDVVTVVGRWGTRQRIAKFHHLRGRTKQQIDPLGRRVVVQRRISKILSATTATRRVITAHGTQCYALRGEWPVE